MRLSHSQQLAATRVTDARADASNAKAQVQTLTERHNQIPVATATSMLQSLHSQNCKLLSEVKCGSRAAPPKHSRHGYSSSVISHVPITLDIDQYCKINHKFIIATQEVTA